MYNCFNNTNEYHNLLAWVVSSPTAAIVSTVFWMIYVMLPYINCNTSKPKQGLSTTQTNRRLNFKQRW